MALLILFALAAACAHAPVRRSVEEVCRGRSPDELRVVNERRSLQVDEKTLADARLLLIEKKATTLHARGRYRVCISPTGEVASADVAKTSGLPSWDDRVVRALKKDQYCPLEERKEASPACEELVYTLVMSGDVRVRSRRVRGFGPRWQQPAILPPPRVDPPPNVR